MWDRPAAWTIWRPLTEPRRQPSEANTHATAAVTINAGPVLEQHEKGEADHQPEQHARGRRDHAGEDLAGRGVAEQQHGMLEALVEEAPGNAAQDVGDAGPEEKPGQRGAIGSRPDVAADLEAGQRAGQHEEEAEAFHEDHRITDLRYSSDTSLVTHRDGLALRSAATSRPIYCRPVIVGLMH